ncbi:MAG: histidine kinase [Bacteroidota bacterium]
MNKLIKEIPRAIIISIAVFLLLLLIRFITGNTITMGVDLVINFGYTMLYGVSLYFANSLIFMYLDKLYTVDRFTPRRVLIGFLASFLVSIFVIFLLRIFEDVIVEGTPFSVFLNKETMSNYLVAVILTFIVTLAFHTFYFYKAYNENRVKEQKIIAGTASAKFESLKNQIDPHFLFNSLNVLSSLIEENPENAQRFTTSLSKIYRYVLEQKDKELVTVHEELAFAKTYMNLLKMRFENSITFELPENFDNSEAKVVPLSLQLLLENTIKHNVVSEQKPLHIKIFIKDNCLVVQNDLQKKEVLSDRRGVGLQNIINRYGILTQRKVLIDNSDSTFAVHLPILTKQITIMETTYIANENTAYYKAKKRVEELKGFYGNLLSYCIVIPILIFVNLNYMPEFQWFWFSLGGWGFGLIMHAFKVFGYSSKWEEKQIAAILDKDKNAKNWK